MQILEGENEKLRADVRIQFGRNGKSNPDNIQNSGHRCRLISDEIDEALEQRLQNACNTKKN